MESFTSDDSTWNFLELDTYRLNASLFRQNAGNDSAFGVKKTHTLRTI